MNKLICSRCNSDKIVFTSTGVVRLTLCVRCSMKCGIPLCVSAGYVIAMSDAISELMLQKDKDNVVLHPKTKQLQKKILAAAIKFNKEH